MSYRVKIELTLPNSGHVRLSRYVNVQYEDVLEILQVCATATGDVAERVGTVAHLLETLAEEAESVSDLLGLTVFLDMETGCAVAKYKLEGRWYISHAHRSIFQPPSHTTLWPYLQACSSPLPSGTRDE